MVRVLGNSSERVKIPDLNDIIYYQQQKDYTDQDFESSIDLQKAIRRGLVAVIEKYESVKMAPSESKPQSVVIKQTGISQKDIKQAVTEVISTLPKAESVDLQDIKNVIQDAIKSQESQTVDIKDVRDIVADIVKDRPQVSVAESIYPEDVRQILLEIMKDYKSDGQITPNDVRRIVQDVVRDNQIQGSVDIQEIKDVVKEVVAENKPEQGGMTVDGLLQSLVPLIANTVREEVSKIPKQVVQSDGVKKSEFISPEYIPDVQTDGMKSSIRGTERESSGDVAANLAALKRLKKSK